MTRLTSLLAGALLVGGCASAPRPAMDELAAGEALQNRLAKLRNWSHWGLTGRLSIDDGEEGGSGRLDWDVREEESTLRFRGALGQGAWQLDINADGAVLTRADGTVTEAPGLDALVQRETGWRVPVDALEWWVRGLPQPGHDYRGQFAVSGQPIELSQRGWSVVYERYTDEPSPVLPIRLEATDGDYRVKLAISRWRHARGGS